MSVVVVTGTGTGVGKTVVTAAVAALARARRTPLRVVKPAQTGVDPGQPGDLDEIARLAGLDPSDLLECTRYPDPLSPAAAARRSGLPACDLDAVARELAARGRRPELLLIEGAGGLLVRYDEDGATLADLAAGLSAEVLVVTEAGLGTLNATALTLEAMATRGLRLAGLVIGSWPAEPGLAERSNVRDLEALAGRPLSGVLAQGVASLAPIPFLAAARRDLAPQWGGDFDAADFRRGADLHPGRP